MAFCPACRYEYESGIHVCPDCDETLMEALPSEKGEATSDIRFTSLPSLPGRVYADMVTEVLKQRGIPFYIRADGVVDAFRIVGTGPVSRGVKVYVPEDRLEECLDIQRGMLNSI